MKNKEKSGLINFAIVLLFLGGFTLLISIAFIGLVNETITFCNPINYESASQIGSFFNGIVGVLWSGAGVILIYATFRKQHEFNKKQAFEQTFQNMINHYHTVVNNTRDQLNPPNGPTKVYSGRRFYNIFFQEELKNYIKFPELTFYLIQERDIDEVQKIWKEFDIKNTTQAKGKIEELEREIIYRRQNMLSKNLKIKIYEFFYEKHQGVLGHYFRLLFNIFKYIIETLEEEEEKQKYINLIQAQMSNDELGILFYNALSKYAKDKKGNHTFKKWLELYNFFENIDKNSLIDENDKKFYEKHYKEQIYKFV